MFVTVKRNELTVKLLGGIFPSKLVRKGRIMKTIKNLLKAALISVFICVAFIGAGGGAAFAEEGDGPTPAHDPESEFGPIFYIGLGAVAIIATFAIWQNVKDSDNKDIETEVKEAEEREVEDFEEYFENLDESDSEE